MDNKEFGKNLKERRLKVIQLSFDGHSVATRRINFYRDD